MPTSVLNLMVGTDHAVPVEPSGGTATVLNVSGGTLYYADNPQVSASNNQGTLVATQSQSFAIPQWIVSASLTTVQVVVAIPDSQGGSAGPQGPQGAVGPPGPQGLNGPAGAQGPAGMTWRGAWASSNTYAANDAVAYNNASYFALNPVSPGGSNPTLDTTNWQLLAAAGPSGPQGPTGSPGPTGATGPSGASGGVGPPGAGAVWKGAWNSGTSYAIGDGVSRSGNLYISNTAANVNHDPASDTTNWTILAASPLSWSPAPPSDLTSVSSGVDWRGGHLKVVYEVLNAADGYLDPTSTADQSAAMQSFVNVVKTGNGGTGAGYIPPPRNANNSYRMGSTTIDCSNAHGPCHIFGDDGGSWVNATFLGNTCLEWPTDTGAAPETTAGMIVSDGGKISGLSFKGPGLHIGHHGQRPSALAGLNIRGGVVEHCVFQNWGAGVLIGGSGQTGDHWNLQNCGMLRCGFGMYTAAGTVTAGDMNLENIFADCYLAAVGTAAGVPGLTGASWKGGHLYGPYGFMRFDDGSATGTVLWVGGATFEGCNVEAPGNGGMYDELYLSNTLGASIIDNDFGSGMFTNPGPSWGRTWTQTCPITASGSNTITVTDSFGGFVFRKGMTVTGNVNIPAGTIVTAISGTWPAASYTLTLNNAVTSPTGTAVIAMPVIATITANSITNNRFPGQSISNAAIAPFMGFTTTCAENVFTSGNYVAAVATANGPTNTLTQSGMALSFNGSLNPALYGNQWGTSEGMGTKLTSMRTTATVAKFDLVQSAVVGANWGVKTAVAASPVPGRIIGIAQQAVTAGGVVDIVTNHRSTTVNNKSGTNTIASGALIYPDAVNAGGVSSTVNGNPIGVANGLIAISSTGGAQLFCS